MRTRNVKDGRDKMTVDIGSEILQMPDFIHDYEESTDKHTFKGSLARHIAVERVLMKISWWFTCHDAIPGYTFFSGFLTFLLGLNCNFPAKDVALYTQWYVRGCKPVAVFKKAKY